MPLKEATEEELQQVDEEGHQHKIYQGQKVLVGSAKIDPEAERMRESHDSGLYPPALPEIESPRGLDKHFLSQSVVSLTEANFDDYIKSKQKALIYFYDSNASYQHVLRENEFSLASDNSTHYNYGFGGVDCFYDRRLCDREIIKPHFVPTLKLYSNGFDLSTIECNKEFNRDQMLMLMKMTPILLQPRVDIGRDFLAKAVEKFKKPKKKKETGCCG